MKSFDAKSQREQVEAIETLSVSCGYPWYKGQKPDEQIKALLGAFTELLDLKSRKNVLALPAPSLKLTLEKSLEQEKENPRNGGGNL